MDDRFRLVQKKLNSLNYCQPVAVESLPLVEKLLGHIETLQGENRDLKESNRNLTARCFKLENQLVPCLEDKHRLIKENDELQSTLDNERESFYSQLKDVQQYVVQLQEFYSDFEFLNSEHLLKIKEVQEKLSNHETEDKAKSVECKISPVKSAKSKKSNVRPTLVSSLSQHLREMPKQINNLMQEKEELQNLLESYKSLVLLRERDVKRLLSSLQDVDNRKPIKSPVKPKQRHNAEHNYVIDYVERGVECSRRMVAGISNINESLELLERALGCWTDQPTSTPDLEQVLAQRDYYMQEYNKFCWKLSQVELNVKLADKFKLNLQCPHARLEALVQEHAQGNVPIAKPSEQTTEPQPNKDLSNLVRKLNEDCKYYETKSKDLMKQLMDVNSQLRVIECDCNKWKSELEMSKQNYDSLLCKYNHLKLMQEHTERSLKTTEDSKHIIDGELTSALDTIKSLQNTHEDLNYQIAKLKGDLERQTERLRSMDRERDSLVAKLDEKTEQAVNADKELKKRYSRILKLETTVKTLTEKLDVIESQNTMTKSSSKLSALEVTKLKEEISSLNNIKDNLLRENRSLQDNLASVSNDCIATNRALAESKKEVDNLKRQLQGYVSEIQHIDDLLQEKEAERSNLLDHFRTLSREASALETNNQSLENEAKSAKVTLREFENKLSGLENVVHDKNSMVADLEHQVSSYASKVQGLETRLALLNAEKRELEVQVKGLNNVCSALKGQKSQLEQSVESSRHRNPDLDHFRSQISDIQNELMGDRDSQLNLDYLTTHRETSDAYSSHYRAGSRQVQSPLTYPSSPTGNFSTTL